MKTHDEEYTELIHTFIEALLVLQPMKDGESRGNFIMGVLANVNAGVICNIINPGEEYAALEALADETRVSINKLIPQAEQYRASLSSQRRKA
ncbi:MAG TPA: hypothetical protein VK602_19015 [Phyllobacterium sp.]|nr:hypothetical protein [Phyllobacterium sp.]